MRKLFVVVLLLLMVSAFAYAADCTQTGFERDGINLTAALVNPTNVTGEVDATGCNIGVYIDNVDAVITNANIHGANYFGVVVNGDKFGSAPTAEISGGYIYAIGESPLNGSQHGVAVYYRAMPGSDGTVGSAGGSVSNVTVYGYQKGGIVLSGAGVNVSISGNTVTGAGSVDWIAQNGIQVGYGAAAIVSGNIVSKHFYTPATWVSCGILYYDAGGVKAMRNFVSDGNQRNFCNSGKGGGDVVLQSE